MKAAGCILSLVLLLCAPVSADPLGADPAEYVKMVKRLAHPRTGEATWAETFALLEERVRGERPRTFQATEADRRKFAKELLSFAHTYQSQEVQRFVAEGISLLLHSTHFPANDPLVKEAVEKLRPLNPELTPHRGRRSKPEAALVASLHRSVGRMGKKLVDERSAGRTERVTSQKNAGAILSHIQNLAAPLNTSSDSPHAVSAAQKAAALRRLRENTTRLMVESEEERKAIIERLLPFVSGEQDPEVQRFAMEALGHLLTNNQLPAGALQTDDELRELRDRAVEAMREVYRQQAEGEPGDAGRATAESVLQKRLGMKVRSQQEAARERALERTGGVATPKRESISGRELFHKVKAIEGAARLGGELGHFTLVKGQEDLVSALADDVPLRIEKGESREEILKQLLHLVEHGKPETRVAAADAIAKIANTRLRHGEEKVTPDFRKHLVKTLRELSRDPGGDGEQLAADVRSDLARAQEILERSSLRIQQGDVSAQATDPVRRMQQTLDFMAAMANEARQTLTPSATSHDRPFRDSVTHALDAVTGTGTTQPFPLLAERQPQELARPPKPDHVVPLEEIFQKLADDDFRMEGIGDLEQYAIRDMYLRPEDRSKGPYSVLDVADWGTDNTLDREKILIGILNGKDTAARQALLDVFLKFAPPGEEAPDWFKRSGDVQQAIAESAFSRNEGVSERAIQLLGRNITDREDGREIGSVMREALNGDSDRAKKAVTILKKLTDAKRRSHLLPRWLSARSGGGVQSGLASHLRSLDADLRDGAGELLVNRIGPHRMAVNRTSVTELIRAVTDPKATLSAKAAALRLLTQMNEGSRVMDDATWELAQQKLAPFLEDSKSQPEFRRAIAYLFSQRQLTDPEAMEAVGKVFFEGIAPLVQEHDRGSEHLKKEVKQIAEKMKVPVRPFAEHDADLMRFAARALYRSTQRIYALTKNGLDRDKYLDIYRVIQLARRATLPGEGAITEGSRAAVKQLDPDAPAPIRSALAVFDEHYQGKHGGELSRPQEVLARDCGGLFSDMID